MPGLLDWFLETDVFDVPEDYNRAEADRLYGYIDGPDSDSKKRRVFYFKQVRDAVEKVSQRKRPNLPNERMQLVRNTLEASIEKMRWQVNGDLKTGVGNVATDTTVDGWWERTKRALAGAIVHLYQLELDAEMKAAA